MFNWIQTLRNDDLKALGVDDSKKLTEEQREELLQKVIKYSQLVRVLSRNLLAGAGQQLLPRLGSGHALPYLHLTQHVQEGQVQSQHHVA